MTSTLRVSNINDAGWTELSNGSENVLVDLNLAQVNVPDVLVRVESVAPDAGSFDGFVLNRARPTFPFSGLAAEDKVYARTVRDTASVTVAKS